MFADLVREEIANAMHVTFFFTVTADEAISLKSEQFCLHYTQRIFIDCSASHNTAGVVRGIENGLNLFELQEIPIVAQLYHGFSVMSGHLTGVQHTKEGYPCTYTVSFTRLNWFWFNHAKLRDIKI